MAGGDRIASKWRQVETFSNGQKVLRRGRLSDTPRPHSAGIDFGARQSLFGAPKSPDDGTCHFFYFLLLTAPNVLNGGGGRKHARSAKHKKIPAGVQVVVDGVVLMLKRLSSIQLSSERQFFFLIRPSPHPVGLDVT